MHKLDVLTIAGVPIAAATSPADAWNAIRRLGEVAHGGTVHLCNAYTFALAAKFPQYRAILAASALCLPDGAPVAWAARHFGLQQAEVCRGPDLLRTAFTSGVGRHVLVGGRPGAVQLLMERYSETVDLAPPISIPFVDSIEELSLEQIAKDLQDSRAQYAWIGLGTPKQDQLASALTGLAPQMLIGVGAAFNFLTGSTTEAPLWLRGTGFEWVYRLLQEPGRLWRRYTIGSLWFLVMLFKEHFARRGPAQLLQ